MQLATTEHYHAIVIKPKGRFLGSIQGPEFKDVVRELSEAGKTNIVLDLSQTSLMDSSGIGVLIEVAQELRENGGDLKLAEAEAKMRNLFLMTRLLGDVFEMIETVDEAVESFADGVYA